MFLNQSELKLFYCTVKGGSGLRSRHSDSLRAGRSGDRIPVGARFFAPVQTDPGTHPASYTMGTGSLSRGVKRSGRGVDHPSPSSAEVKEWVELYLYPPSGPSWPVLGSTFNFIQLKCDPVQRYFIISSVCAPVPSISCYLDIRHTVHTKASCIFATRLFVSKFLIQFLRFSHIEFSVSPTMFGRANNHDLHMRLLLCKKKKLQRFLFPKL
jgi:hypothetical protein